MGKLILIILLGLLLRVISINQSLWLDEATSVLVARDYTFGDILTKFSPGDFHPPLYYLTLKVWILLFGSTEIVVRMLSVLFGIATIPVIYGIGKTILSKDMGLVAALFLATAPLHVYYSQEARMYAMETLLATIVAYFVIKKNFVWLMIVSVILLYTDYLPVFLLVSFFLYFVIYERKYYRQAISWIVATGISFIPWMTTFFSQLESGFLVHENAPIWWSTLGRTSLKEIALVPVKFMIGRISSYDKVIYAGVIGIPSLFYAFLFVKALFLWEKTKFLWLWLLVPIITGAILGLWLSVFSYFRFIFVLPAFYILLTVGAMSLGKKGSKFAITGILVINLATTGIYLFESRFHREDWRGAVGFIEENSRGKRSATFFPSTNQSDPYKYYGITVPYFGRADSVENFNKIWLMRYVQPIFDPEDSLRKKIENGGYTKLKEHDFNGVVVWEYENWN